MCGERGDNAVINDISTMLMRTHDNPISNKRKFNFVDKTRNIDVIADESYCSNSLDGKNLPHVPGFVDWLTSGNTRLLLMSFEKYSNSCNVKNIIMNRIELIESVNWNSSKWRNVVKDEDKE